MTGQLNGVAMVTDALWSKHAAELAEMWPCRLLSYLHEHGQGREKVVGFHILMLEYPQIIETLARVAIPGFVDIQPPFLHEYASISPGGRIFCDMTHKGGLRLSTVIYHSKDEMISVFRRIADKLKLKDTDRVAMFTILGKFISCDLGIDVYGEHRKPS